MRLQHLQFDNFLKLNLFDVDLSENTVHLFAGSNEAGKSSVQEAIRFALTGEVVRVSSKSDYKLMIRDGAKIGTVKVKIDDIEIVRDIKTAKELNDETQSVHLPPFLPYLLNAQQFAQQKNDKRRSFLINLTGTQVKADDISRRMKAKNVTDECIEMVLPMLRSGFTATHKEAVNRATEARQQWTGLTGAQRYGSQIAATWKPEIPENFDHKDFLDKEQQLSQIKESIDALNVDKGGLVSRLGIAEKSLCPELPFFKKAALTKVQKGIAELEQAIATQKISKNELNNALFIGKDEAPVTCCECGTQLSVEFNTVPGSGRTATCTPFKPLTQDEIAKIQTDIFTVGSNISTFNNKLTALKTEEKQMLANKAIIDASKKNKASPEDIEAIKSDLTAIDLKLDDRGSDHTTLNESLVNMRIVAEKIKVADQLESKAKKLHESVVDWSVCVEALSPEGIPAEILSDTLKPVNDRLRNTSNVTGWAQVKIDPTMEIIVDGRRYSLLSESAQWRADVAITDAISHLSGIGIMIIDRLDVLDLESRANFMIWIQSIMSEFESILIFGTLKKAPKLPDGMKSYWMVGGEII